MTSLNFSELGLAEPIERALRAKNYQTPTPIQAGAIPQLLDRRDLFGIAQTGTGKTAAFSLPILHRLHEQKALKGPRNPRALILAPTRELAIQIGAEISAYGKFLNLHHTVIFGGVGQKPQTDALNRGIDILIATPGRLLDLMNQRRVRLDHIQVLVLDEADRMLDMGFVRDVRKIIAALPAKRQSLLFSATMPDSIAKLAADILTDPVRVEVTPQSTPIERIEQSVHHVSAAADKLPLLTEVLRHKDMARVIVFTRTKHRANRVADRLSRSGITADAIHGNKSQSARQRALERFRSGGVRVLVATDIAARGIDIDDVSHVINYELPNEPESYVHRIGRTARAGADGTAVSFCEPGERGYLRDIERLLKNSLSVVGEVPAIQDNAPPAPRPAGRKRSSRNRRRRKAA